MFRIMLQKILHKKWMVCSLLIGNILLIAIAASHPMYQEASQKRMLSDEFTTYLNENNAYPTVVNMTGRVRKQLGKSEIDKVRTFADHFEADYGVKLLEKVCYQNLLASDATSLTIHDGVSNTQSMFIASLSGLDQHTKILTGRMYSDSIAEDGYVEAVISQSAMVKMNLLVGEELEFEDLLLKDGSTLHVRIVGVYTNAKSDDLYWVNTPDSYDQQCMISPKLLSQLFLFDGAKKYSINEQWHLLFDYSKLRPSQVDSLLKRTNQFVEQYNSIYLEAKTPAYVELLNDYAANVKQITVTLSILEVPVIVLLCAFLFMISRQMFEMEENEIAIFKSRGASKNQIIRLYLMQSGCVSFFSFLIGLPLGSFLCRVLGASSAFLEFGNRRSLTVAYTPRVILFGLLAVLLSIIMTITPVLRQDKATIVSVKRKKRRPQKPFWQRTYLDLILLAVSLYGFYSFKGRETELLEKVISGKALDPLLFLSSSLFILGAGFASIRLQNLIVKLLYQIRKKSWKPASYISFLQLIRTRNSQSFIIVFLVLTVALGVFNTTVARTILSNAQKNKEYTIGADIILQEKWEDNSLYVNQDPTVALTYTEPDYGKFGQIKGAKAIAKVYRNDKAQTKIDKKDISISVMGIDTKPFGEVTSLNRSLLKYPYYTYLNVLSKNDEAVLVSSNFRDQMGLKIGDQIAYTAEDKSIKGSISGTIYGFFDYWPTYSPTSVTLLPDGSVQEQNNYLIVGHLARIQNIWGVLPYEIWMKQNGSTQPVYQYINDNNLQLTQFTDQAQKVEDISREPLFQGTNGILTMSFIVILLICSVGYLIYWILSIRSRELLFGILRAMGVTKEEILHMLVNEQILTGFFAILFGAGIGVLASHMYVPMIQIAYSGADRVLPLELITKGSDLLRLFLVIGAVFLACLIILIRQVFRMKISQALKLGED